ncbi:MAG: hypothetical protein GXX90_00735, partial [Microbacteriaceae bacterium]|nr:hypothetical protein [Microbacteriaceae bacterium]
MTSIEVVDAGAIEVGAELLDDLALGLTVLRLRAAGIDWMPEGVLGLTPPTAACVTAAALDAELLAG